MSKGLLNTKSVANIVFSFESNLGKKSIQSYQTVEKIKGN